MSIELCQLCDYYGPDAQWGPCSKGVHDPQKKCVEAKYSLFCPRDGVVVEDVRQLVGEETMKNIILRAGSKVRYIHNGVFGYSSPSSLLDKG